MIKFAFENPLMATAIAIIAVELLIIAVTAVILLINGVLALTCGWIGRDTWEENGIDILNPAPPIFSRKISGHRVLSNKRFAPATEGKLAHNSVDSRTVSQNLSDLVFTEEYGEGHDHALLKEYIKNETVVPIRSIIPPVPTMKPSVQALAS